MRSGATARTVLVMRAHHRLSALLTMTTLVASCAGSRRLDPPPAPPAIVPAIPYPTEPPAPGTGRILIDIVDGPSDVQIRSLQPMGMIWAPLCTSPCVVDLPPGPHELSFLLRGDRERSDTDTVTVSPAPSMYRRQLLQRSSSPVMLVGGYVIGYTGVLALLGGLLISTLPDSSNGRNIALTGAAMTAGGGLMFYLGWPTEKPGAVTQVRLSP